MVDNKIHILPENVINKIAAGEIVERPASVVKELVENSIDAGAKNIRINFFKGGKYSITVEDDGIGMTKEEILLAIKRHATSKLHSIDDLGTLATFGFRGEALPSISSISNFTIISGKEHNSPAIGIIIHGGKITDIKEYPPTIGTKIIVDNLFYNVPARRKFLRTDATEGDHIITLVKNLALFENAVKFTLLQNNIEIFSSPVSSNCGERINEIFKYNEKFIDFFYEEGNLLAQGSVCDPDYGNVCKKHLGLFINKRLVKNDLINAMFCESLRPIFPSHRGVLAYLLLTISPHLVDTNVHPMKMEVRFKNEFLIKNFIKNLAGNIFNKSLDYEFNKGFGLETNLDAKDKISLVNMENNAHQVSNALQYKIPKDVFEKNIETNSLLLDRYGAKVDEKRSQLTQIPVPHPEKITSLVTQKFFEMSHNTGNIAGDWKILGLSTSKIAIFECNTGIIFFNIKSALNRIIYERLLKNNLSYQVQKLLLTIELSLSNLEAELIEHLVPVLNYYGISIYSSGKNEYKIDAIPEWLSYCQIETMVKHLISEGRTIGLNMDLKRARAIFIKNFHYGISIDNYQNCVEIERLKNELFSCENPMLCPLGQAIYFEFSFTEINRRFG